MKKLIENTYQKSPQTAAKTSVKPWSARQAGTIISCLLAALPSFLLQPVQAAEELSTINLPNADIETAAKAISHNQGTPFLVDPRVKGTINLVTEKPMTKAQILQLFTSLLRLQGGTVVIGDGFAKIVPESDAKLHSSPTQISGTTPIVKGDQIVSQIFRLNYESATNLVTILRPLISPNNTVNSNPGNNTLVITDYADNVTRLGKIIAALDTPSSADIDIIPIRYAVATDIAQAVGRLTESTSGGDGGRISALADPRTNAIILRAPSVARANFAKTLIAKLDQPTEQAGNVHVVYLKNADATKLAATLRAVVSSDSSANASPPSGTSNNNTSQQQSPQQGGQTGTQGGSTPIGSTQGPQPLPAGGAAGFIQADAASNTIIITASEPIYRNLRAVIDLLDTRRAQVYIESLIVEVTANKAAEFGIQWLGLSGNDQSRFRIGGLSAFNGTNPGSTNLINLAAATRSMGTTGGGLPTPGAGLTLGLFRQINGELNLGALVRALETDSNANILSTPNLITLDNEEAKIIVGQNVPFISGSFQTPSSGGSNNPFQTIERRDVGLMLRVRPQISEGGTIKMSIFQEMSSVEPTSINDRAGLTTNKRSIETNVLADDNQVIVLGGLITDTSNAGIEKVPGLGNLPVIGNLFKFQNRERKKTNLLVFLRPVVIRTAEQSAQITGNRYDYIRGSTDANKPEQTPLLPDTSLNSLPPLENGKLTGDFIPPVGTPNKNAEGKK